MQLRRVEIDFRCYELPCSRLVGHLACLHLAKGQEDCRERSLVRLGTKWNPLYTPRIELVQLLKHRSYHCLS